MDSVTSITLLEALRDSDSRQAWERFANRLGITRNAVYLGKNRVLTRLRELRRQMERTW